MLEKNREARRFVRSTTTRTNKLSRVTIAMLGLALFAASCGDDAQSSVPVEVEATATEPAVEPEPVAESEPATEPAEPVAESELAETEPAEAEPAEDVDVELVEGAPQGMPTEFGGPILIVDPSNPPSPAGGGGFFVTLIGPVTAEDGTTADMRFSVYDFRAEGGSVQCGGQAVEGAFTAENSNVSSGVISIAGWGKADVRIESTAHAFVAQLGAPFCDEQTGTWTGFEGELDGRTGTFHRLMVDGLEAITLG